MTSQRNQRITTIFWITVLVLPVVTGVFHLDDRDAVNNWLDVLKTALALFGYCLIVGVLGPRLLRRLNVFQDSAEEAAVRNQSWLERSIVIGLGGGALALWLGWFT